MPSGTESAIIWIAIDPMWVVLLKEPNFPNALPAFDPMLTLHRGFQFVAGFEPH
jgi:hypothetical protein